MRNIDIGEIIFLSTWFGAGFLVMVGIWISDMRGQEFDKNYFDVMNICLSLAAWLLGYISLAIACYIYLHNNKPFTKLMYKIANIGVKKTK